MKRREDVTVRRLFSVGFALTGGRLLSAVGVFCICVGALGEMACSRTPPLPRAKVGKDLLAALALASGLPAYPPDSVAKKVGGIAAVQLYVDESGSVYWTRVLDAPNRQIAHAVSRAVADWRFRPLRLQTGELVEFQATQLFLFEPSAGTVTNLSRPPIPRKRASRIIETPSEADDRALEIVLDVRPRELYRKDRRTAVNVPLDELPGRVDDVVSSTESVHGSRIAVGLDCSVVTRETCLSAAKMLVTAPRDVDVMLLWDSAPRSGGRSH